MTNFSRNAAALVLAFMASSLQAEPIPTGVTKALKPLAISSISYTDTILRIAVKKPVVTDAIFSAVIDGICTQKILNPADFKGVKISKIEVMNDINRQGLALENGLSTCDATSTLKPDEARALISNRTQQCSIGVCK